MTWDLALGPNRDLVAGIVTGEEEVIQRLITRLQRELGEWFVAEQAGLPWYQQGQGLLGSKNTTTLELLIRKETLNTDGVLRIIAFSGRYSGRQYNIAMTVVITGDFIIQLTITEEGVEWQTTE